MRRPGRSTRNHHFVAVGVTSGNGWRLRKMQLVIRGFLHALTGDALAKISLRVEKAHPNKGQIKVAGFFTVIAGEYAKTARVDRQSLVQTELSRKIGDSAIA